MLTDNLCMGCMRELGEEKVCPHCGLHADFVQESPLLPLRTVINDRYIIGKAISTGGDGVTYIAWDRERNVAVAVREFLPLEHIIREFGDRAITVKKDSSLVVHDGIMAFLELWRKIARLRDLSALKPVVLRFRIHREHNAARFSFEEPHGLSRLGSGKDSFDACAFNSCHNARGRNLSPWYFTKHTSFGT